MHLHRVSLVRIVAEKRPTARVFAVLTDTSANSYTIFDAAGALLTRSILAERKFIAAVLHENPFLRALRYEVRAAKADVVTARLRANPVVGVTGDVFPVPGRKWMPVSGQYGVSFQLTRGRGNKRAHRSETAEAAVRVWRGSA